jgi:hypothetical protein
MSQPATTAAGISGPVCGIISQSQIPHIKSRAIRTAGYLEKGNRYELRKSISNGARSGAILTEEFHDSDSL